MQTLWEVILEVEKIAAKEGLLNHKKKHYGDDNKSVSHAECSGNERQR